jgi:predicted nuclease with TOPRIM domain
MSDGYLQLRNILFKGPKNEANLEFTSGVNVICGASDTGKSFLAESIDFMLGGSELREISELAKYAEIELDLHVNDGEDWRFRRSTSGGNFKLIDLDKPNSAEIVLKQNHAHGKTDNLSGFLLEKIGLLGKRILKSGAKATTQSLSFRNIARLILVQENEIQQRGSPFWGGQYTTKTAELATVKLLLTNIDDSSVVSAVDTGPNNGEQITLIDELLADIATEIEDMGEERDELTSQLDRLETSIEGQRESLSAAQRQLESLLTRRREALEDRRGMQDRLDEITDLLARFDLLREHYAVDIDRLQAIRESGSMFAHVEAIPCPLCGANPEAQHLEKTCEGDVDAIVVAAIAEIEKIERLLGELEGTVADLRAEEDELKESLAAKDSTYQQLDKTLQEAVAPEVSDFRNSFSEIVEKRADVQKAIDLFARRDKLENRKLALQDEGETREDGGAVKAGIPESVAHSLSKKVSSILKAWDFPGECHVYFDKQSTDFVIDGKPRGSRGKGLRAITHAAVSIALLEYCQENGLSHPGFVVLDSPLLAYFKPEGEDDLALKGTDLKERFYDYLVTHHGEDSQVIIIENQHPPQSMEDRLVMTIFTGNPNEGRFGLL